MDRNRQGNYRIGAFAAVNTGKIYGCSTNIVLKAKNGGSGFVYDNRGEIGHSVSNKTPSGKGKLAGFVCRDTGHIRHCGFISNGKMKEVESEKQQKSNLLDISLWLDSKLSTEEIYRQLKLETVWKNESTNSLEPDWDRNHTDAVAGDSPLVEISNADDLLAIIDAVNDGDEKAASGHYILTSNINLRGKTLEPLGRSERNAFRGILDGNGKKISNFVIDGKGCEYAGFIGVADTAQVINLKLDYILKSNTGKVTGGMVAANHNSRFENCVVCINLNPGICTGGFVGQNGGLIRNCYVCGKIAFPLILWPLWFIPGILLLALLALFVLKDHNSGAYVPEIIDPNQVPVINPNDIPKPEAGTSRISFEVNQEIYVSASTQVGAMNYVNPARATQDVVVRICISDSKLELAGYDLISTGVRTVEEKAAEGYKPGEAYTELYRSGRIKIGYGVDNCKLSPLPNGATLKAGDYEMVIFIDSYDPETFEKSIINANVPITVHIVDQ